MTIIRSQPDLSTARPTRPTGPIPLTRKSGRTGRVGTTVRLTGWANSLRSDTEIEGWTFVPPEAVNVGSLSATGLLAFLYSFPADEPPTLADVVAAGPDGRHAVQTVIRELVEAGFVEPMVEFEQPR